MTTSVFTKTLSGRFIMGDLFAASQKTDDNEQPLFKDGKPVMGYFFGVAIPKTSADWKKDPAYADMYAEAVKAFPRGEHSWPSFAFKISDGDLPNQRGKTYEHAKGCWLFKFSTQIPFKKFAFNAGAWHEVAEGDIKCGDYIQVQTTYAGNGQTAPKTPGMYMNPLQVAFSRRGVEIVNTPEADPTTAGFTPGEALDTVGAAAGAAFTAPANQQAAAQHTNTAAVNNVQPNHNFLNAVPDDIPDVPVAGPQLTAKAPAGVTYEMFIAKGWTDDKMRAAGYLV